MHGRFSIIGGARARAAPQVYAYDRWLTPGLVKSRQRTVCMLSNVRLAWNSHFLLNPRNVFLLFHEMSSCYSMLFHLLSL